jgi:hypothetical protein
VHQDVRTVYVKTGGPCHTTADLDGDGHVSLSEILRTIQFYNAAVYHCAQGTKDGYDPGPGNEYCAPYATCPSA